MNLFAKISLILVTVLLSLIMSNEIWRWLLFNSKSASKYADKILSGSNESSDEFIDYTVYTAGKCVVFSKIENTSYAMIYCSELSPSKSEKIGDPHHIIGRWYYFRTNTN